MTLDKLHTTTNPPLFSFSSRVVNFANFSTQTVISCWNSVSQLFSTAKNSVSEVVEFAGPLAVSYTYMLMGDVVTTSLTDPELLHLGLSMGSFMFFGYSVYRLTQDEEDTHFIDKIRWLAPAFIASSVFVRHFMSSAPILSYYHPLVSFEQRETWKLATECQKVNSLLWQAYKNGPLAIVSGQKSDWDPNKRVITIPQKTPQNQQVFFLISRIHDAANYRNERQIMSALVKGELSKDQYFQKHYDLTWNDNQDMKVIMESCKRDWQKIPNRDHLVVFTIRIATKEELKKYIFTNPFKVYSLNQDWYELGKKAFCNKKENFGHEDCKLALIPIPYPKK